MPYPRIEEEDGNYLKAAEEENKTQECLGRRKKKTAKDLVGSKKSRTFAPAFMHNRQVTYKINKKK